MTAGACLRVLALAAALAAAPAHAKEAAPLLEDRAAAARLEALSAELRCLVCQGQSLAESDSDFANDMRREIYAMIRRGRSDEEIVEFLVQRYGDFILFRPPMKATTALLWFGPLVLLATGAAVLGVVLVRRRKQAVAALSAEEQRRAEALLAGAERGDDAR